MLIATSLLSDKILPKTHQSISMNPRARNGGRFVAVRWLSDARGTSFFCALADRISELGIVFSIAIRRLELIYTDVPAKNSKATAQQNSLKAAIFGILVVSLSLVSVIAQTPTDEAQRQFESLLPQLRSHHPDQYDTPEKLQTAWRLFRQNIALAETARRKGYADTPEIRARLTQMLAQEIILKEAETARPMHAITEAEIRAHFAANRDKYDVPTMLGAHEIVFPYDPADAAQSQKQWAKAKEVLKALAHQPVELGTFQELIKTHSDPLFFRSNGGSLGVFPSRPYHGQTPPLPETAVAALLELKQVGRVTEVLDDGRTLRILRLNAYRPAVSPKLETLKESIRRELYLQARDSRIEELARESGWDPKAKLTAEQLNRLLRPAQPVGSSTDFPPTPGGLGIPVPK